MSVTVFEHANFQGKSQTYTNRSRREFGFAGPVIDMFVLYVPGLRDQGGRPSNADDPINATMISSFRLSAMHRVEFYEDIISAQPLLSLSGQDVAPAEMAYVGDKANDRIRVIRLFNLQVNINEHISGVILHEAPNFKVLSFAQTKAATGSRSQRFGIGDFNLPYQTQGKRRQLLPVLAKQISAITVGSGFYVEVFDGPAQTGQSYIIAESTLLDVRGWDNRIMSIRVRQLPRSDDMPITVVGAPRGYLPHSG